MPQARIPEGAVSVRLSLPQPYAVDPLLGFLGQRAVTGVELVMGRGYARTLRLPGGPGVVRLELGGDHVVVRLRLSEPADVDLALQRCRWLLDLDIDLTAVEDHLSSDPHLAPSVAAHRGMRVPGHVDGFEVAVRAIVGQQISVAGARTVLCRLVAEFGDRFDGAAGLDHLFPSPAALAAADPERLPMPRARGRALVALAEAVSAGVVVLDRTVGLDDAKRSLLALPGVGPWTADYIALRALGDPDVFMGTDLGVRHGLARLGLDGAGPETTGRWSPWRSYALMHIWKSLDPEPS